MKKYKCDICGWEDDPDGLTRWAVLTPVAELDSLSEVFVVTGFREAR